jgi:hypothetical protein
MSLPTAEQNGVFTHVYPVTDLGMSTLLGVSETVNGTNFSTGVAATLVIIASLVSGAATLTVDLNNGSGYTSADATLSLSGTDNLVLVVNTDITYDDSSPLVPTVISANTLYAALRLVSGGSGCQVNNLAVFAMYELDPGEDWFQGLRSSANAVSNRTISQGRDGKGQVSLSPTAPVSTVLL